MLNVVPVYCRLKDVTNGETTSVSRKEPVVGETAVYQDLVHGEEKEVKTPTY